MTQEVSKLMTQEVGKLMTQEVGKLMTQEVDKGPYTGLSEVALGGLC